MDRDNRLLIVPGSREVRRPKMVTGSDVADAVVIGGVLAVAFVQFSASKITEVAGSFAVKSGNRLLEFSRKSDMSSHQSLGESLRRMQAMGSRFQGE